MLDSIGSQGAPKVAREFWVEQRKAPFMYEGHYPFALPMGRECFDS